MAILFLVWGMSNEKPVIHKGLDNIYVKETEISFIDGQKGKLYYRGYPIEVLAEKSHFEEVAYLLWYGWLPKKRELDAFKERLKKYRNIPDEVVNFMKALPKNVLPMDVLKAGVSILGAYDPGALAHDLDTKLSTAEKIMAKIPTIIAYWYRIKHGKEPIPPNPDLDHAANFLYMIYGKEPDELAAKVMDVALILHAEHGMNASTFANLVAASTLTDLYSATVAGIAALKGPLHGGANERALRMIMEVGSPDKAEEYIKQKLAKKERIMGFGHRVYKTFDPRAKILKKLAKELAEKAGKKQLFETAEAIERVTVSLLGETKRVYTNVDFYSGIVYHTLGIPIECFPAIFAMARVVGWTAHTIEYWAKNRLIRPRAHYKGKLDKEYIPIELR